MACRLGFPPLPMLFTSPSFSATCTEPFTAEESGPMRLGSRDEWSLTALQPWLPT